MPVANYCKPIYRLPIYSSRLQGKADYSPGKYPVVDELWKRSMVVTPICRPPLTKNHMEEFLTAIYKVAENVDDLINVDLDINS